MSKEELKRLIDERKKVLILDVRTTSDLLESDVKIKGAVWIPPSQVHELIGKMPHDMPIVTY